MKKTIAKIMAAAMLLASVPAVTLPAYNVEAASSAFSVSVSVVKFTGDYETNKVFTNLNDSNANLASEKALEMGHNFGMTTTGNSVWTTNIQYLSGTSVEKANETGMGGKELKAGNGSLKSDDVDLTTVGDYKDNTGTVKKIETDSKGKLLITLDSSKFTTSKINDLALGNNNLIEFYPWTHDEKGKLLDGPVFTIQVGKVYVANKTEISNCMTDDGFIYEATVKINKDNQTATLIKVSDTDKKVRMKSQKIEVSNIEVGGISYPVTKFEEQALKSAKMKKLTAKNIKNVMTGAVRGCKKVRQVNMGNTKIKRIHSNAFYDCEKLRRIKIKCHNLKSVGHYAFKKLKKNCTISIKAGSTAKYNAVVKMIKKSGVDQVKFKKA